MEAFTILWQVVKAFAIIYGAAYAIGFIVAMIKHRREVAEAAKVTTISGDVKVWLLLGGLFGVVLILNSLGA